MKGAYSILGYTGVEEQVLLRDFWENKGLPVGRGPLDKGLLNHLQGCITGDI
jgi:hypothetical protein